MESNPYEINEAATDVSMEGISDETVRNRYIREEVCIIAVGWFYYCMAAFQLSLALSLVVTLEVADGVLLWVLASVLGFTAPLFGVIGYGLRHFKEWARLPSMMAAVVGVFMIPIGTFAGIYSLYLLNKSKSKEMFDGRYGEIVAKEKHKSFAWLAIVFGIAMTASFWMFHFFIEAEAARIEQLKDLF